METGRNRMLRSRLWQALFFLLLTFYFGPVAPALQSTYGDITGTVTDQSGAIVPGAKVEAVHKGTDLAHQATTDGEGTFRLVNLDAGEYDITVTAVRFSVASRK